MRMFVFLLKRVLVLALLLAVVSAFVFGVDLFIIGGILAGGLVSVCKAALYGSVPVWLALKTRVNVSAILMGLFSQLLSVILLVAAVLINVRLFFGLTAGLLTTALIICINTFTEQSGLTRNRWGEPPQ